MTPTDCHEFERAYPLGLAREREYQHVEAAWRAFLDVNAARADA